MVATSPALSCSGHRKLIFGSRMVMRVYTNFNTSLRLRIRFPGLAYGPPHGWPPCRDIKKLISGRNRNKPGPSGLRSRPILIAVPLAVERRTRTGPSRLDSYIVGSLLSTLLAVATETAPGCMGSEMAVSLITNVLAVAFPRWKSLEVVSGPHRAGNQSVEISAPTRRDAFPCKCH